MERAAGSVFGAGSKPTAFTSIWSNRYRQRRHIALRTVDYEVETIGDRFPRRNLDQVDTGYTRRKSGEGRIREHISDRSEDQVCKPAPVAGRSESSRPQRNLSVTH